MITGGGPTSHPEMLQELCKIGKHYDNYITIETEGSEYVSTEGDLISLSPKLSNSTPRPGTVMPFSGKVVTEKHKERHEKWRCNYDAMKMLIDVHPDYQLKPVISNKKDIIEEFEIDEKSKIYLSQNSKATVYFNSIIGRIFKKPKIIDTYKIEIVKSDTKQIRGLHVGLKKNNLLITKINNG